MCDYVVNELEFDAARLGCIDGDRTGRDGTDGTGREVTGRDATGRTVCCVVLCRVRVLASFSCPLALTAAAAAERQLKATLQLTTWDRVLYGLSLANPRFSFSFSFRS